MSRLIVFAAVLSIGMGSVSAQEGSIAFGTVSGEPGEVVQVPITMSSDQPIRAVIVNFVYDVSRLEFLDFGTQGTEAATLDPLAILYRDFGGGEANAGFQPERKPSASFRVPAGEDRHVGNLRFLIRALAEEGSASVHLQEHIGATAGGTAFAVDARPEGEAYVSVFPASLTPGEVVVSAPSGPRPVGDLSCGQILDRVELTFAPSEPYDEIRVLRDGEQVATLAGDAVDWSEALPSIGAHDYSVVAVQAEELSVPVSCEVLGVTPAAPPVEDLVCSGSHLEWTNPIAYNGISVLRDGTPLAELPGDVQAWTDPDPTDELTVYTVIADEEGFRSPETSCISNGVWVLEAGDVQVPAGATSVSVPMYATTSTSVQGLDMYLGIDTSVFVLAGDFEASLEGTVGHPDPEYFHMGISGAYPGAPAAGILYDYHSPQEPEKDLPPGLRQHIFNFVFDVEGGLEEGDVFPVTFRGGAFSLRGATSQPVDFYLSGAVHCGSSGPLPVKALGAQVASPAGGQGSGGGADSTKDIALSWRNGDAYDAVRLERNGTLVAEIAGESTSYRDPGLAGGIYTYKVIGVRDGARSFPQSTLVSTFAPPGSFLRGDATHDGVIDIADPVATLGFLFLGREGLPCEDAADTDDSGVLGITDPIYTLHYLFLGDRVIRAPGTRYPWYDPTPDGLGCGS